MLANVVELSKIEVPPYVEDCRNQLRLDLGDPEAAKAYKSHDWQRVSYVLSQVQGARSVLDVGTGQGHFSNAAAKCLAFDRLATIDIKTSRRFRKHGDYEQYEMSAANMVFRDGEFDTVVCMEVIEHIPDEGFTSAISELRRVAGKSLFVTVPLCEPQPINHYHRQRFDPDRLTALFPNAMFTVLLKKRGCPWVMIRETIS